MEHVLYTARPAWRRSPPIEPIDLYLGEPISEAGAPLADILQERLCRERGPGAAEDAQLARAARLEGAVTNEANGRPGQTREAELQARLTMLRGARRRLLVELAKPVDAADRTSRTRLRVRASRVAQHITRIEAALLAGPQSQA